MAVWCSTCINLYYTLPTQNCHGRHCLFLFSNYAQSGQCNKLDMIMNSWWAIFHASCIFIKFTGTLFTHQCILNNLSLVCESLRLCGLPSLYLGHEQVLSRRASIFKLNINLQFQLFLFHFHWEVVLKTLLSSIKFLTK